MAVAGQVERSTKYRKRLAEEDKTQVLMWCKRKMRSDMDELVKSLGYRNRSQLIEEAVAELIKAKTMK
jgi:metal-responsive CopG/Arc/MetJ family transcriptional regulator